MGQTIDPHRRELYLLAVVIDLFSRMIVLGRGADDTFVQLANRQSSLLV